MFSLKSGQWEWSCFEILVHEILGKDAQEKYQVAKDCPRAPWMQSVRTSFALEVT